ncbi:unnamed protein product [Allacma fusca]|uniref:Uncharacterized protein n=1 Tax=Allacma fusca TaxID=39272 RepID=A0A8J2JRN1_9HEXA|nr:unnamed protein product [Allacma fusca]
MFTPMETVSIPRYVLSYPWVMSASILSVLPASILWVCPLQFPLFSPERRGYFSWILFFSAAPSRRELLGGVEALGERFLHLSSACKSLITHGLDFHRPSSSMVV